MAEPSTRPARRTQQERRAATQRRVLAAAVDCLVEVGYGGLSSNRVADRAGVSRGALLQQYPTREQLVVAAVEHLFGRRAEELRAVADGLPPDTDRTGAALSLLWTQFSSPLFKAGLELWVAARTDAALREALLPFDRALRRLARQLVVDLFGRPANEHPDFGEVIALVLNSMHGAALQRILQPSASFRRQQALLDRMTRSLLTT
jgi:AcrR family transcriptional regulator